MKRILLVICLIVGGQLMVRASDTPYSATIQIKVDEGVTTNAEAIITIYEKYFRYAENLNSGQYKQTIKKGESIFEIELPNQMVYFTIDLKIDGEPYYFHTHGKTFLLEASDDISFWVRKERISIFGEGSAKVRCQNWLYEMETYPRPELLSRRQKPVVPADVLNELQDRSDLFYARQLSVLDDYKNNISPQAYRRMKQDCFGIRKLKELKFISSLVFNPQSGNRWLSESKQYLAGKFLDQFPVDDNQSVSKNSVEMLYEKEKLNLKIQNKSDSIQKSNEENFPSILDVIVESYHNTMRDQLLFHAFSSQYTKDTRNIEHLINDALLIVRDSISRTGLQNMLKKTKYGAKIRPFQFWDMAGQPYTLKNFKDKVVIFDFWFKGCMGCASLHSELKPIQAVFKDNKNVIFVTVNVDNTKQKWNEGLTSGLYTDPEMLNLHIGPAGMKDEWLEYYGFVGYPHVMIIGKNQKLISLDPPRPANNEMRQEFIELIRDALAKE